MAPGKWLDRSQPQTLVTATILLYIDAVYCLLYAAGLPLLLIIGAGLAVGGWGVANEKKWGYWLAVVAAILNLVAFYQGLSPLALITLVFDIALVALLLHPMSRGYKATWFR